MDLKVGSKIHFVLCPCLFVVLLILSPQGSFAFINTETIRKQNTGDGFFGNTTAKISGQSGNTNKLTTGFSTLNIDRGARDEAMLVVADNYGRSDGAPDTNNAQGMLRYTFFDRQPTAWEVFLQSEFDQFKGLKTRNLVGGNLRERLLESAETSVYLGAGAFAESEVYDVVGTRRGIRFNFYAAVAEKLDERLTGSATVYYQPLVDRLNNDRVRLQADLDLNLTKRLLLNLEYTLGYDSWVPRLTVQKTDQTYLVGATVKY